MAKLPDISWSERVFDWSALLLFTAVVVWLLTACAGPYRGPDIVPDRIEWGYAWGNTFGHFRDSELWAVTVGWDLAPPPLPNETDSARNDLLRKILADRPAPGTDGIGKLEDAASFIDRHPVLSFVSLIAVLAAGGFGVIRKRLGAKQDV